MLAVEAALCSRKKLVLRLLLVHKEVSVRLALQKRLYSFLSFVHDSS